MSRHYTYETLLFYALLSCSFFFMTLLCCRSWRSQLCKGSCALVCVSVDHDESQRRGAVRGVVLESQYLLEPCGTARTRLTHVSRVDLRWGHRLEPLGAVANPTEHCVLCSLQGEVSGVVQQGLRPPVCEGSPDHPLLFSPAGPDEPRDQDLSSRSGSLLPEHLGLMTSDSRWRSYMQTEIQCLSRLLGYSGRPHRGIHLFNDQFSKTSSCI